MLFRSCPLVPFQPPHPVSSRNLSPSPSPLTSLHPHPLSLHPVPSHFAPSPLMSFLSPHPLPVPFTQSPHVTRPGPLMSPVPILVPVPSCLPPSPPHTIPIPSSPSSPSTLSPHVTPSLSLSLSPSLSPSPPPLTSLIELHIIHSSAVKHDLGCLISLVRFSSVILRFCNFNTTLDVPLIRFFLQNKTKQKQKNQTPLAFEIQPRLLSIA